MPNEADTCRTYVLPKLQAAGLEDDYNSMGAGQDAAGSAVRGQGGVIDVEAVHFG